ncbi:MAG: alpha/beta hydrolase [Myxococcota bacterium]|nr:alpha/beta hydrolase [Myxococcota bacterium]
MSLLKLLYWLGPWMDQKKEPSHIERKEHIHDDIRIWLYEPPKCTGTIFILPGLHQDGPGDPRLERFAKVLANAGIRVGVPFLPTAQNLVMVPTLLNEARRALRVFLRLISGDCGIFSISASSIAALMLAADDEFSPRIKGVMLFGGVSNWKEALLFAAKGEHRDPLNLPVIFLNLWSAMQCKFQNESDLIQAWYDFIHETWEKEDMRYLKDYGPVAQRIAATLVEADQEIFLMGCSLAEGGVELVEDTLSRDVPGTEWLSPKAYLKRITMPVHVAHGRDDVVVPWQQAFSIGEWGDCQERVYITGFYDHTGISSTMKWLRLIPQIPLELYRSLRLLRGMLSISHASVKKA